MCVIQNWHSNFQAVWVIVLLGLLLGCGGTTSSTASSPLAAGPTPAASPSPTPPSNPSPTPTPTPSPSPSPAPTPSFNNVVMVVLENAGYSDVIGSANMPFLNSLAQQYALATNYYADTHPSIGNYFMLTTGQIVTNDDAFNSPVFTDNVVRELAAAGKTWRSYAESLPSVGYTGGDQYPYLHRHDPLSYFTDVLNSVDQQANLVPFAQFTTDLSSHNLPNYAFVVPNAQDDAHDCPAGMSNCQLSDKLKAADTWLQTNIAPLVNDANFQTSGLLVIVFDEADTSDTTHGGGHVAMVLVSPQLKHPYQSSTFYQHESLERFTLELLGVTNIPGAGAGAPDMTEFMP